MEKEIKLKKKKSSKKESISIFFDKRKRYWMVLLCITPLIVVACIFGFVVYKEAKGLMSLAQGEDTTIKNENIVTTMDYRLRDNATEYQKEIFSQLKDVLESEEVDDQMAVELIAKNYIADFYTFTNKAGQYDIGGMYYWYSEEDAKINIYQAARDGFYKYVSNYITDYGAENLIEVEDIQITKCIKEDPIKISVHWAYEKGEDDEWHDIRKEFEYDTYNVSCTWTYKEGYLPSTTKFPTSLNLIIIKNDKFEIIYTSEKVINVKSIQKETQSVEETESINESESRTVAEE